MEDKIKEFRGILPISKLKKIFSNTKKAFKDAVIVPDDTYKKVLKRKKIDSQVVLNQSIKLLREIGIVIARDSILLTPDEYYYRYTKKEVDEFLKKDFVDRYNYIETIFDCDKFSQLLAGNIKVQLKGIPFAEAWFEMKQGGHAINLFFDGTKIYLIEPQSDLYYKKFTDFKRLILLKF